MERDLLKGAARLSEVSFSAIRVVMDKVRALREAGRDVVPLVAGEPDFNTPEAIKEATVQALRQNHTHYGSNRGEPALRRKIAALLERESGVSYDPETEILVTCGGAEAINHALLGTIDPGDEVILFSPAFVSYENLVRLCGGIVVDIPLRRENGFQIDLAEAEAHITERTKMIVINNPCNPTGVVYSRAVLSGLAALACKYNLLVFTDEIYSRLTYGVPFLSMASFPGMRERTILLGGFSKTYAMTGWRLGYLAADKRLTTQLLKLHQYSTTSEPTFLQIGLANAVDSPETCREVEEMIAEFSARRALLLAGLDGIPPLRYVRPDGAFYVFLDVSGTGLTGEEFAARLLEEQLVGTVPGIGLGRACGDFIRLSYATSRENIAEGLKRIGEFVRSL